MGQRDLAQNDYFSDSARFADVCNGILFGGREVIKAEELMETDTDIVYQETKGKLRKIIPDKIRIWNGTYFSIITLENQTIIDYSMVFRMMKEEAVSYEKQWKKRESQRIWEGKIKPGENLCWVGKGETFVPVITLVIYLGVEQSWDGPIRLYDMLDIRKELEPYITNYKMNLFDFHKHNDFSMFKTENRELFELLSCANDKAKMKQLLTTKRERFSELANSVIETMCKIAGIKQSMLKSVREDEEVADVCKAWDDWGLECEEKGRTEMTLEAIKKIMDGFNVSAAQAMNVLKIPEEKRRNYLDLVNS